METKKKSTNEKIAELKKRIVGCKDPKLTEQLLNQLLGLHKSTFEMNRLLDIPLSEVRETIDFGACEISRTIRGYLFTAKGGMYTFVEYRMTSICTMLQTLFDLHSKADKTEDENAIYNAFSSAVLYCFQCIIFSSMNEETLYGNATDILRRFEDYANEHYNNAKPAPESEQDIKENIEEENIARGLEAIADAPLPPEENE